LSYSCCAHAADNMVYWCVWNWHGSTREVQKDSPEEPIGPCCYWLIPMLMCRISVHEFWKIVGWVAVSHAVYANCMYFHEPAVCFVSNQTNIPTNKQLRFSSVQYMTLHWLSIGSVDIFRNASNRISFGTFHMNMVSRCKLRITVGRFKTEKLTHAVSNVTWSGCKCYSCSVLGCSQWHN